MTTATSTRPIGQHYECELPEPTCDVSRPDKRHLGWEIDTRRAGRVEIVLIDGIAIYVEVAGVTVRLSLNADESESIAQALLAAALRQRTDAGERPQT